MAAQRHSESGGQGKVLLVSPQPFYDDRGTPIAVRQVVEALSHLDYRVDLVTYPIGRAVAISGLRVFRSPNPFRMRSVPIGFSARKLLLDATLLSTLWARLRSERYLCIHAVEEAAFPAIALGRWLGLPVIYDMASSLPEQMAKHLPFRNRPAQAMLRRCERWLLRNADLIVTSAGLAAQVRATAPEARVREWQFSSLGSEVAAAEVSALRADLGIPDGAPVVLYSGTFEPYQGLPELLDAIPRVLVEIPRAVFALVGADGARGAAIARQIEHRLPKDSVRVVPRQPRDRIPGFLAMADVLVSPRRYGGNLPLKIFDYLAAGKPIVATDIPSHRSVLDESCAELVEPSHAALAAAIARVLSDPSHAARLATGARTYAETQLGWIAFVRSIHALYAETTARADTLHRAAVA